MKKHLVRVVALALVAILALALLPLGALAANTTTVIVGTFEKKDPAVSDPRKKLSSTTKAPGTTIKASSYDKLYKDANGNLYDFRGFATLGGFNQEVEKINNNSSLTPAQKTAAIEKLKKNTKYSFSNKDLKIDPYPTTAAEQLKWHQKWDLIIVGYTPHTHKMSRWYSDGTTHWKECMVCHEDFVNQNLCQDGDEDGYCNVCGGVVPYHSITVVESTGGKITVNKTTAAYRTKITADVDVADGYKLKKLHFIKVRTDGSRQEIPRNKQGDQYWTYMPTYDLEVTAEFIKK